MKRQFDLLFKSIMCWNLLQYFNHVYGLFQAKNENQNDQQLNNDVFVYY